MEGGRSNTELQIDKSEGIAANAISDHPVFKSVIQGMKDTLYTQIAKSSFWQKREREEAYRMLRTIESFEGQFTRKINKGKKAANLLEQLKSKLKR